MLWEIIYGDMMQVLGGKRILHVVRGRIKTRRDGDGRGAEGGKVAEKEQTGAQLFFKIVRTLCAEESSCN